MSAVPFKMLTAENLLVPDPVTLSFSNELDLTTNEFRMMTREEFLSYIFQPSIGEHVSDDVRRLFEAARGALCYGFYFYPLFMLGFERACGAAEAAARSRAREFGANERTSFFGCVELLAKSGVLSAPQKAQWDAIRTIRNQAAHPKMQQIMMPGPCISMLPVIAAAINDLCAAAPQLPV